METMPDTTNLHRTAKYFMDSGRARTHEEAMGLLKQFGLTIHVGPEIADSAHQQAALLTLVNMTRRTLLGGVEVAGLPDAPCTSLLGAGQTLRKAVQSLGGQIAGPANHRWPAAIIGNAEPPSSALPRWRLKWSGWRGGVVPGNECRKLPEHQAIELAPVVAAAACAAEVFAHHAGDHPMAGRRTAGLSLWRPGADWLAEDESEPVLYYLPSRLWLIGLGNLGQAYAWALACLPYQNRSGVQFMLHDFDRISASNESTSVLSFARDIGRRKTRTVADWLEKRGFETLINETRFGEWTRRAEDEPAAALCGVDNPLARAALGKAGFGLVVETGLGGGPEAFRSLAMHTFPSSRSPEELWSRQVGMTDEQFENRPAYQALKSSGLDSCGVAQLASRTVAVPFVGMIAGCLAVSEILRRLNGGCAYEVVAGSLASLSDWDSVPMSTTAPYAWGYATAARQGRQQRGLTAGDLVA
jgi:hypothetical protein